MAAKDKQAVIDHLKQIAHMFGKLKDQWRGKAFSNAASTLEARHGRLPLRKGKLTEKIPGIGNAIKDVIEQFVATGTSEKFKKLRSQLPKEDIVRFDSATCKRAVTKLLKPLTEAKVDWGFAGSVRRGSKTCKDVDVVVCLKNEKKERDLIAKTIKAAGLENDVRNGQIKIGVTVPIKSQGRAFTLDLIFTYPSERGAAYLYFTGPKAFNIKQRSTIKEKGMRLNEKGLFKNGKQIAGKTEKDMFAAMGFNYLEPAERS